MNLPPDNHPMEERKTLVWTSRREESMDRKLVPLLAGLGIDPSGIVRFGEGGPGAFWQRSPDLGLISANLAFEDAEFLFQRWLALHPELVVLGVLERGDVSLAASMMRLGAFDVVDLGASPRQVETTFRRALAESALRSHFESERPRFLQAREPDLESSLCGGFASWHQLEPDGMIHWSPAMAGFHGLRVQRVPSAEALGWVRADHQEQVTTIRNQAWTSEETVQHRYSIVRPDGQERWLRERLTIWRFPGSTRAVMAALVEDITEARALSAQKLHASKMEILGRVAGGFAHDFNNALTVIRGYLELLQASPRLDDPLKQCLGKMVASTEKVTMLTQQLHAFGRRSPLGEKSFDLNLSLRECIAMLRRVVREDVAIQFEFGHGLPKVGGDPNLLQQLALLLVIHVRSFVNRGGEILVRTSLLPVEAETPMLGLWIVGCAARELDPLSESLQRSILAQPDFKDPQDQGLMLCAQFIGLFGGHLRKLHPAGFPPSFLIEVPVTSLAETTHQVGAMREDFPDYGVSKTILVVEDDEPVIQAVSSILRANGFTVLMARNAAQALAQWSEHQSKIDLLFADVVLPGEMTGCELGVHLKSQRPSLPVLYTSGYAMEVLPHPEALIPGVNYVGKPVVGEQLVQHIRRVIRHEGGLAA